MFSVKMVPVQLSSAEGLPETEVKTRKRPSLAVVAIIRHFYLLIYIYLFVS